MREFVRQRPLASFYVLAVLIAIAAHVLRAVAPAPLTPMFKMLQETHAHLNILTAVKSSFEYPGAYTLLLFPAAPMIAALLVAGIGYGRSGYRELFSRCAPWRSPVSWRQGVTVIAICFTVFFALTGMMWVQSYLYAPPGTLDRTFLRYGGDAGTIYAMLAASLLISPGPLLEELGWRGFALPQLLRRYDPLTAAIVLGVMWWAWHFPRDVPALFSGAPGAAWGVLVKQLLIAPGFIASTIIAVFVCNKLGGSLWGGLLTHAIHNELGVNVMAEWSPTLAGVGLRPWDFVEYAVAIVLVLMLGRNLGASAPFDARLAWGDVPPQSPRTASTEPSGNA